MLQRKEGTEPQDGLDLRRLPPKEYLTTAARVEQRLKAERVQELLKSMPGWQLLKSGRAIDRARRFTDTRVATAYAVFVLESAGSRGLPVNVLLSGEVVMLTLHGPVRRETFGELTTGVLELAHSLG